eukprot:gene6543-16267_t
MRGIYTAGAAAGDVDALIAATGLTRRYRNVLWGAAGVWRAGSPRVGLFGGWVGPCAARRPALRRACWVDAREWRGAPRCELAAAVVVAA